VIGSHQAIRCLSFPTPPRCSIFVTRKFNDPTCLLTHACYHAGDYLLFRLAITLESKARLISSGASLRPLEKEILDVGGRCFKHRCGLCFPLPPLRRPPVDSETCLAGCRAGLSTLCVPPPLRCTEYYHHLPPPPGEERKEKDVWCCACRVVTDAVVILLLWLPCCLVTLLVHTGEGEGVRG